MEITKIQELVKECRDIENVESLFRGNFLTDLDLVEDELEQLKLCEVNHTLMIKKEAERREEYAHLKVQIAIERFIEIYWDGEDELTFEDVNKRLKLH